jgi:hypothetical protein
VIDGGVESVMHNKAGAYVSRDRLITVVMDSLLLRFQANRLLFLFGRPLSIKEHRLAFIKPGGFIRFSERIEISGRG